ncbi:hypothetical protein ACIHFB_07985 [Streptomyces sp. NPDC051963]|uniref:hypothetical protein n=1 Tax=Streptomyces sp. NPDC051963 TaxID=3365678 RepID=UPI0037D29BB5
MAKSRDGGVFTLVSMDGTRQLSPELTGAFAGDLRFPVGGTVVAFLHRHRGNAIRF